MVRVGVYPISTPMPCSPRDLHITPYVLPIPHLSPAAQEAAARLLMESARWAEGNEWVSVSWEQHLLRTIRRDIRAHETAHVKLRLADTYTLDSCRWHMPLLFLTIGLHARFCNKENILNAELPQTKVVEKGELYVCEGLERLHQLGLITIKNVVVGMDRNNPDDAEIHQIFGPTPELVYLALRHDNLPRHHRPKGRL